MGEQKGFEVVPVWYDSQALRVWLTAQTGNTFGGAADKLRPWLDGQLRSSSWTSGGSRTDKHRQKQTPNINL